VRIAGSSEDIDIDLVTHLKDLARIVNADIGALVDALTLAWVGAIGCTPFSPEGVAFVLRVVAESQLSCLLALPFSYECFF
jgi:hypothetical protein